MGQQRHNIIRDVGNLRLGSRFCSDVSRWYLFVSIMDSVNMKSAVGEFYMIILYPSTRELSVGFKHTVNRMTTVALP